MAQKTVDVTALALRAGSGLVSADQVIVFDQTGNTDRMPFADAVAEANSQNGCVCTLDDGYDAGGAGVGREIVADTGAVKVTGTDGLIVTGVSGDGADSEWVGGGAYDTGMFFNPKKAAFRVGIVDGTQWDDANVGDASVAIGANGVASGFLSLAIGSGIKSKSAGETALGTYNTDYTPTSTTVFSATDRILGVGNGASSGALSDALIILKNGKTTMPSTTGSFTPNVLTTTERNALTATAGMMIYNSTTSKHQGYDGSAWNDFY